MDIHIKIAAALHVACGVFVLFVVAMVALVMGGVAAFAGFEPHLVAIAATFGGVVAVAFLLVGIAQIVAGILCFRGSNAARVVLVVFSLLSLVNFPIGTAIGGYSLWAFLRKAPDQPPAVVEARNI